MYLGAIDYTNRRDDQCEENYEGGRCQWGRGMLFAAMRRRYDVHGC